MSHLFLRTCPLQMPGAFFISLPIISQEKRKFNIPADRSCLNHPPALPNLKYETAYFPFLCIVKRITVHKIGTDTRTSWNSCHFDIDELKYSGTDCKILLPYPAGLQKQRARFTTIKYQLQTQMYLQKRKKP